MPSGLTSNIIPWDDQSFVNAFELARDATISEGLTIHGPKAAARAEQLLRAAGFPDATIEVRRTPDQAMAHTAHWIVRRDRE